MDPCEDLQSMEGWWRFRRPIAASAGLVAWVVGVALLAPATHLDRTTYLVLTVGAAAAWWPVILIGSRYGFRVGVAASAALCFVVGVAGVGLSALFPIPILLAAPFREPPWKDPLEPWRGTGALRAVVILLAGLVTAMGLGWAASRRIPEAGSKVTICFSQEPDQLARSSIYLRSTTDGVQNRPGVDAYIPSGEHRAVVAFVPFATDAEIQAVVDSARQRPEVTDVVPGDAPCPR